MRAERAEKWSRLLFCVLVGKLFSFFFFSHSEWQEMMAVIFFLSFFSLHARARWLLAWLLLGKKKKRGSSPPKKPIFSWLLLLFSRTSCCYSFQAFKKAKHAFPSSQTEEKELLVWHLANPLLQRGGMREESGKNNSEIGGRRERGEGGDSHGPNSRRTRGMFDRCGEEKREKERCYILRFPFRLCI